ncbi:MAG TPA: Ada metal-binding domain-containing protein [Pyrinomonadaceae bacterium]|nr:Ada metal-binding domain-containing protein [Pyrinomonadaceae bacterium]
MVNHVSFTTLHAPKTFLLLPLLLMVTCLSAPAQCTVKKTDLPAAPELLGFRLGMTKQEVKVRVPQTVFGPTDPFGLSKTTINPYFDPKIDKTLFENVRSVSLDLLDEHVTSIWIGFDENFKVVALDDFVKLLSDSFHLAAPWSDWKSRGRQVRCADFQLIVTTVARGPSFRLVDTGADDTIAARRLAKEEEQEALEANQTESDEVIADKTTKIFYSPNCPAAKNIADPNKVIFKTQVEAEKAGFKLSPDCQ